MLPDDLAPYRDAVINALVRSLKAGTVRNYNNYLARFVNACAALGLPSWRAATTGHVLVFLCDIARGLNRPSSTLESAISALKLAFESLSPSPLDSPLISRVKKGLVDLHTTRPRAPTQPLPVAPIRDWLLSLPPTNDLDYDRLRMKCAVLAALVLIARPSDLCCIDPRLLEFEDDLSAVTVSLLAFKNDYHRDGAVLRVEASSVPELCFVRACKRLHSLNFARFPNASGLFIDPASGAKLLSAQVGQILKRACTLAGLGAVFTARNFRPGGATRGIEGGLPLDLVMHIGRWRSADTVYAHYLRSARPVNVSDTLLAVPPRARALEDT